MRFPINRFIAKLLQSVKNTKKVRIEVANRFISDHFSLLRDTRQKKVRYQLPDGLYSPDTQTIALSLLPLTNFTPIQLRGQYKS